MKNYINAMRNFANIKGRANRAEYWQFIGVVFLMLIIAGLIGGFGDGLAEGLGQQPSESFFTLFNIVLLVHFIPSIAVTVRRAHDANLSGLWAVIGIFIPIAAIVIGAIPSFAGDNKYGPATTRLGRAEATPGKLVDGLEKIVALKAAGAIDDAEFAAMKQQLMKTS